MNVRDNIDNITTINQKLIDTFKHNLKIEKNKNLYNIIKNKQHFNYIKIIKTEKIKLDSKKYKQKIIISQLNENVGFANFRIEGFDKCYINEIIFKIMGKIVDKYNFTFDKNVDNFKLPFYSTSNKRFIPNLISSFMNSCIYNLEFEIKFNELKKDMYLVYDIVEIPNMENNEVLTICNDHFDQELILKNTNKLQEFEIFIKLLSFIKNIELKFFNNKNNKIIPDPKSIKISFMTSCGKIILPLYKSFNNIYTFDFLSYNIIIYDTKLLIEYENINDDFEIYVDIKYSSYNSIKMNNGSITLSNVNY